MNPYSTARIYKLYSPYTPKYYIGSTILPLAKRLQLHTNAKDCTAKQVIDAGCADIDELELFPCLNKFDLEDREAAWQLKHWDNCVNQNVAGAVRRAGGLSLYQKARYSANRAKLLAQVKAYRLKNRAKLCAMVTCECGGRFQFVNTKQHVRSQRHIQHLNSVSTV